MKNNTEIVITKFNTNIDVSKKYNVTQLINLLSIIYENNTKKIKLIHEIPLLLRENDIKKKMILLLTLLNNIIQCSHSYYRIFLETKIVLTI